MAELLDIRLSVDFYLPRLKVTKRNTLSILACEIIQGITEYMTNTLNYTKDEFSVDVTKSAIGGLIVLVSIEKWTNIRTLSVIDIVRDIETAVNYVESAILKNRNSNKEK